MTQQPFVIDGSDTGEGFPRLVIRMNKRPRVHWWAWLFCPRKAWWITQLIRESFDWRESSNGPPNALTWAESAFLRPVQAAQWAAVMKTARRINDLADRYESLRTRARVERRLADAARQRKIVPRVVPVFAAGPITVIRAKEIIETCRQRIEADTMSGQTRHQETYSKRRERLSLVPLLVDVVALITIIARFFNVTLTNALTTEKIPETASAVGFALIGSAVLALLAHAAGNAAWHLRATNGSATEIEGVEKPKEFPSARHLLTVKLVGLFAVSATTAVTIAIRIMHPTADVSTGPLGVAIGVAVALATFIAPWLVVLNKMRSGTLEVRTIDELTSAIKQIDDAVERHDRNADNADDEAVKVRLSADRADANERESETKRVHSAIATAELARSHHRQNGRYAIDDDMTVEEPFITMAAALSPDRTAIKDAMSRFDSYDDEYEEV